MPAFNEASPLKAVAMASFFCVEMVADFFPASFDLDRHVRFSIK